MATLQKTYEQIKATFPGIRLTQIVFDLDRAQKRFVEETSYLHKAVALGTLSTTTGWILPSDYNQFKEILMYDSSNEPIYLNDYDLDYEISEGNIYFKSKTSVPISGLNTAIATVYLVYYYSPVTVTAITDSFAVEDNDIIGIESQVYESYYARFPVNVLTRTGAFVQARDSGMVRYWQGKAQEAIILAKKHVIKKNNRESRGAVNYGMAGDFAIAKRVDETAISI